LERIVKGKLIANLPITSANVQWAEKVYGPSVPSLKGRTTHRQLLETVPDLIPVGIPRPLYEEVKRRKMMLNLLHCLSIKREIWTIL
jgi:hypothetical protein